MIRSLSRIQAFNYHLALSAAVVGTVCAIVFFVWYPHPYFKIVGAWSIIQILVAVDLILGPLLTLMLFKPGKKGLMFDIAFIAVFQLAALIYGTAIVYQERPYFLVFAVDRFEVLAASEVDAADIPNHELLTKPTIGPMPTIARLPDSPEKRQQVLLDVIAGKPDIERRPEFWHPYSENIEQIVSAARPLEEIAAERDDAKVEVDKFLARRPEKTELVAAPIIGKQGAFYFVIDRSTATPVGVIDINPWSTPAPENAG